MHRQPLSLNRNLISRGIQGRICYFMLDMRDEVVCCKSKIIMYKFVYIETGDVFCRIFLPDL